MSALASLTLSGHQSHTHCHGHQKVNGGIRIMKTSFSSLDTAFTSNSVNRNRFSSVASSRRPLSTVVFPQTTRTTRRLSCVLSMSKKDDGFTYKDSGVDIDAGTELITRISKMAPMIGGFSGGIPIGDTLVVLGMDGVGTKLKLAFETGIHETIGIDLVAMSVNDIVTCGAKPLGFLDYYGTSDLDVDLAEKKDDGFTYKESRTELIRRIIKRDPKIGESSDCILIEGDSDGSFEVIKMDAVVPKLKLAFEVGSHETIGIDLVAKIVNDIVAYGAKPVGFLFVTTPLDVDLAEKGLLMVVMNPAVNSKKERLKHSCPTFMLRENTISWGCALGKVKKDSLIDGKNIVAGDVLIGLPSSGLHCNGFALARRVLAQSGLSLKDHLPGGTISLGEALMAPTVIYVKQVLDFIDKGGVKGLAHITRGGLTDSIPQVLPDGLSVVIHTDAWNFHLCSNGSKSIEDTEMRMTFNMGIGMVMVVSPEAALRILGEVENGDYVAYRIGQVIEEAFTTKPCFSTKAGNELNY
ncbi:unnamed protein product [Thlaspi arvense]|uniref:phosphoribosylformylglycinamidine cyclo-ligase n=1 Tax=Thlaspi arvense TaxID=13288 RepID=A0AAU9SKG7_THLAR|nr:unnamed protein product [Thlaspi arvense]